MKPVLSLWIALLAVVVGCGACHATSPEPGEQTIAITIEPAAHRLSGQTTLSFTPNGARGVSFTLQSTATVTDVRVGAQAMPIEFSGGILNVDLPPGPPDRPVSVAVRYLAAFNDPLPARGAGAEDPSYGVNGVISVEGVFLGGSAAWYPQPQGMPPRRRIEVTTPPDWEAVTVGRRVARHHTAEQNVSVWEELHPVGELSLSAGRYEVFERQTGSLPIYAYLTPANAHLATRYLDASAAYVTRYEGLFGPYPFEKFAIVENFFPTGYGFPSYTLLGGTVLRLPFIIGTSLPHEIAHNWWGNGVLVGSREGNWSEGLVTYLADYLLEEKKGPAAGRDYRYRILTDYASLVPVAADFPLVQFMSRSDPPSRAIGYGKGAMLFHMVRRMIGDDAFFAGLRELCRKRLYQSASWSDFTRAFSRAAGRNLAPFMDQWLQRPGGPQLTLSDVKISPEGKEWLVTGRISQASPYWRVPVEVVVETASRPVRKTVNLDGASAAFAVQVADRHGQVALDPEADLFRILAPAEIPPAVNRIKGSRDLLVVRTASCRAGTETLTLLLQSLGQSGVRVVRENQLKGEDVHNHDILICGSPDREDFLPVLSRKVKLITKGFAVGEKIYNKPEDSLFVVGGNPADRERVAALFIPGSDAAAAACLPKITHYGKYGYLVFAGAENIEKGLAPPAGGGSIAEF